MISTHSEFLNFPNKGHVLSETCLSSSGVKNNGLKTTFMTDFRVLNGKIEVKKYVPKDL